MKFFKLYISDKSHNSLEIIKMELYYTLLQEIAACETWLVTTINLLLLFSKISLMKDKQKQNVHFAYSVLNRPISTNSVVRS